MVNFADVSVKSEARRRFNAWVDGDRSALPPYLRRVVFGIILHEDPTDEDYAAIFKTYKESQSVDGKEIALASLGDVTRSQLVEKTISFLLSCEIPAQDIHWLCHSLASNPRTRNLLWETLKANWK